MRTNVKGKKIILVGDTTTTGGSVLTGAAESNQEGRKVARLGDSVFCPVCKVMGKIAEGVTEMKVMGIPVALEGHRVSCGCPEGSCRLVAVG